MQTLRVIIIPFEMIIPFTDLKAQKQAVQSEIQTLYSDLSDEKNQYHLHSVLVHDGFAGVGHYWAFVKDYQENRWIKFNDTYVKMVSIFHWII